MVIMSPKGTISILSIEFPITGNKYFCELSFLFIFYFIILVVARIFFYAFSFVIDFVLAGTANHIQSDSGLITRQHPHFASVQC